MFYQTLDLLGLDSDQQSRVLTHLCEPHRYYHNASPVSEIINNAKEVCVTGSSAYLYMVAAAWFHDIVYDIGSDTNEYNSALMAQEMICNSDIDPNVIYDIIISTKYHNPTNYLEEMFCDLDMLILASPHELYRDYVRKIRMEYSSVSDYDFNMGRAKFLKKMVGRQIFHTMTSHERKAKENVELELAELLMKISGGVS